MAFIEPRRPNSEAVWGRLQEGLDVAFRREFMSPKHYMTLYTSVYDYCTSITLSSNRRDGEDRIGGPDIVNPVRNSGADFVGHEMYQRVEEFVSAYVTTIREKGTELSGENLLKFYTTEWENFRISAKVMDGIFAYLNRHWIRRELDEGHENIYMVYTLALVVWKRNLLTDLKDKVIDAMLELIRSKRDGATINSRYISGVVECLVELGVDDSEDSKKDADTKLERVAVEASNDAKLYVKTLLEVHERYQTLVNRSFKNEPGFMQSLDKAATNFINANAVTNRAPQPAQLTKSAELLARYCDQLLRKSSKMPDETELEELQTKIMNGSNDIYQIYVKNSSGRKFALEVTPSKTIEEMKNLFQRVETAPLNTVDVFHCGTKLERSVPIGLYDISENDTLEIVGKMMGGIGGNSEEEESMWIRGDPGVASMRLLAQVLDNTLDSCARGEGVQKRSLFEKCSRLLNHLTQILNLTEQRRANGLLLPPFLQTRVCLWRCINQLTAERENADDENLDDLNMVTEKIVLLIFSHGARCDQCEQKLADILDRVDEIIDEDE
ncbi:unnamed protein product [Caenorhabditis brenneri]